MYSRLEFGSCYVYSKHGHSFAAAKSRGVRDRVKRADPEWLPKYAQRVREYVDAGFIADIFVPGAVLIPVPGSSPRVEGALWVPERICHSLNTLGLGAFVETPLSRIVAVPKSAYAAPGERPSLDLHYESMRCAPSLIQPARIVLVDDVVTKGRTLLTAARRVREAFPNSEVKGFALIRYLGLVPDIESFKAPINGTIDLHEGDAERQP